MAATANPMDALFDQIGEFTLPKPGTLVEGVIISMAKNRILVDINGFQTGIITGKEVKDTDETLENIGVGDKVSAYVVDDENDEGYVVLSLRKANQERTWKRFLEAYENKDVVSVKANEANKGGLLLDINGIKGFIPVSQLAPLHYPRVNDADSNQIFQRLQALVGEKFKVKIINIDKENGKLILSEKAAMEDQRQDALKKLNVGEKVSGTISGIVKFGIFVAFEGLEGLVHISEIAWGHVKNPADYGKLGEKVEVMVIGVEGDKISLSMKRLIPDPWLAAAQKYKIGSVVQGEVNRITPFGAFVKLTDEINGLVHITEITGDAVKDPSELLKIGDKIEAKVIAVEPEEHRVGLSMKALKDDAEKKTTKKAEKTEEAESKDEETVSEKAEEVKPVKKGVRKKSTAAKTDAKAPVKKTTKKPAKKKKKED
jgi:small subunit ribosomal protein S1